MTGGLLWDSHGPEHTGIPAKTPDMLSIWTKLLIEHSLSWLVIAPAFIVLFHLLMVDKLGQDFKHQTKNLGLIIEAREADPLFCRILTARLTFCPQAALVDSALPSHPFWEIWPCCFEDCEKTLKLWSRNTVRVQNLMTFSVGAWKIRMLRVKQSMEARLLKFQREVWESFKE